VFDKFIEVFEETAPTYFDLEEERESRLLYELLNVYFTTRYNIPEDSTTYGSMTALQCWSFLALSALISSSSERRNIFIYCSYLVCVCVRAY
jgi:hypothetical protein